ncbi:response regulator [Rhodoligotrophos defluvii]|uniref:response regulator n=1 Tax=Rhodoligotrophos defluvii TaxID=2561934 RepID=UPI0014857464|nr:response regulator [Rhodoligotrophos defluvii]
MIIAGTASTRHELASMLSTYGFSLDYAETPEQALLACLQRMPDLIMLPDALGSMNSVEFLQRLQRIRRGRSPAVLVCAREASASSIGQAIWEGAAECLLQPFDADILDFKLRQVGIVRRDVAA